MAEVWCLKDRCLKLIRILGKALPGSRMGLFNSYQYQSYYYCHECYLLLLLLLLK